MNLKTKAKFLLGIFMVANLIPSVGNTSKTSAMFGTSQEYQASDDEDAMEDLHAPQKRTAPSTLVPLSPQEFFLAVQHNDQQTIRYLCNQSLDINTQNPMGWTPLHYAVILGNFDMVKFLVKECHAIINIRDLRGFTPRDIALRNNNEGIARFLLNHQFPTPKWHKRKVKVKFKK